MQSLLGRLPRSLAAPATPGAPQPPRHGVAAGAASAPPRPAMVNLRSGGDLQSLADLAGLRDLRTDVEPDLNELELRSVRVGAGRGGQQG